MSEFFTIRILNVQDSNIYDDFNCSKGFKMIAAFLKSSLQRKGHRRYGKIAVQP